MTLPTVDRRAWLALWLQGRRRKRLAARQLLPAPVLWAEYPDVLKWDWSLPNPYRWNVWLSWDNGASWTLVDDYWATGDDRDFAPDGGSELYFIVGVDEFGREITEHSNQVRPDDAKMPAPVLAAAWENLVFWEWTLEQPDRWNVYTTMDGGSTWVLENWVAGASRQYDPTNPSLPVRIVGLNPTGGEITEWSNAATPADAPQPTPNAPVITDGSYEWEATEPGWFDVWIQWTFDHGSFPAAGIEVYVSVDGGVYGSAGAVSSNAHLYTIVQACTGESEYRFKVRYRNGTTIGPFSNEMLVACTL